MELSLHPQQTKAFLSTATEMLYGGAAGGGKSHLMRSAAIAWCTAIPNLQVYIFRRLSDDLHKNHMEGPTGFPVLLSEWINDGFVKINWGKNFIEFWNGAKIHLCHCQYEKDRFKYQGAEIHVLMIDELTHFTEVIYRYLRGRCRLGALKVPVEFLGLFPRIVAGSNPGGIGHNWVKKTFIIPAAPMLIVQQSKSEGGMRRQFIPARLDDNPTLAESDPDYVDRLEGLGNPALVKAMKDGDWDIVSGGALDDVWSPLLILPRFQVPAGWYVDRSFDWGSSHPFSVGWWAETDGTEAKLPDGKVFCPRPGSLIRIHEWYGAKEIGSNEGLKLSPKDIAKGIVDRERDLIAGGWIKTKPKPGPADNQIGDRVRSDIDSIAEEMSRAGVKWAASDKSPGSRKNGLTLVRARLEEAGKARPEDPGMWFMDHCRAAIATLPVLPRDTKNPDDVDTKSEDHVWDDVRYRALFKRPSVSAEPLRM